MTALLKIICILFFIILYIRLWIYLFLKQQRDMYYHIAFILIVIIFGLSLYDFNKPYTLKN